MGSQGDGSAQFIDRSAADQQAVIEIIRKDLQVTRLPPNIAGYKKSA